jgi:DNA protecting protein DprA
MMTDADLGRFALLFLPGFGQGKVRRTFAESLPQRLTAREVIESLAPGTPDRDVIAAIDRAKSIVDASQAENIQILSLDSPEYPLPLKNIPDPPPFLHVRGALPSDWTKAVAVVGTRNPSPEAISATREAVAGMAKDREAIVVSGLAHGIDNAAHDAALSNGLRTVAVLAHGLHMVYPKPNETLAWRIIEEGSCWISEHPMGDPLSRFNLVARDRLQSGLAIATVVIQSSVTGGSMHTALFTLEQRRKLVALEPPATSADWSGNEFLVSRSFEPHDLKKADRFRRYERPHALRMNRASVAQYMAAGLRTSFVPRKEQHEEPALARATENGHAAQLQLPVSAASVKDAPVAPRLPRSPRTSPFVTLLLSTAHSAPLDRPSSYVVTVRLAPSSGEPPPISASVERWHEEGDSDASLLEDRPTRFALLLLRNDRFETTLEYALNRYRRPSAVRIQFGTPISLRLAVGAAKVAFNALNGEYEISTGLSLRADAVGILDDTGHRYLSTDDGELRGSWLSSSMPPVLASLAALYANASSAGSDEFATLGYYALLEWMLGPVNSGLRELAQIRGISISDLRRLKLRPELHLLDPTLEGKQFGNVLKRFKSLRNQIVHGSIDVEVSTESLVARVTLRPVAEELLAAVLSAYTTLIDAGVEEDAVLGILRRPIGADTPAKPSRSQTATKRQTTLEPLLPSITSP